jgi:hypothetical protein
MTERHLCNIRKLLDISFRHLMISSFSCLDSAAPYAGFQDHLARFHLSDLFDLRFAFTRSRLFYF